MHELYAMLVTLLIAVVGGLATGFVLRTPLFEQLKDDQFYDDNHLFGDDIHDSSESKAINDENVPMVERNE